MDIYDRTGRLIIPDPARLERLGPQKGVKSLERKILYEQLYCPQGHPLIKPGAPLFDEKPGIEIFCSGKSGQQIVYLSPFQNDPRKKFEFEFGKGEVLNLMCPSCHAPFPILAPHDCTPQAMYVMLFLDDKGDYNNSVCVCNAWNCYASFLRISGDIFAEVRYQHLAP